MGYVVGIERGQASLLPDRVNYVAWDAAVRGIDAFVDGLDMAGGDLDGRFRLLRAVRAMTRATC